MASLPTPVRVVIADDHAVVRAGLRALLESRPGWSVVGEAVDGEQAVAAVTRHTPDIVLLDISMPKLDGIEAARRLRRVKPSARVIMISINDDVGHALESVKAGARGYVVKDTAADELFAAVDAVQAGGVYFSEMLRGRLDEARIQPAR